MNIIDIIILICLALSAVLGFKDGLIRQLGSLIGIILSIILANTFGSQVAAALGIGGDYANIWGFVIVLLVSFAAVGLVAWVLHKIVSAVGLGIINRLVGAAFGVLKCALILSAAFWAFNIVNNSLNMVKKETLNASKLYEPTVSVSKYIFPAIDWVESQIPLEK